MSLEDSPIAHIVQLSPVIPPWLEDILASILSNPWRVADGGTFGPHTCSRESYLKVLQTSLDSLSSFASGHPVMAARNDRPVAIDGGGGGGATRSPPKYWFQPIHRIPNWPPSLFLWGRTCASTGGQKALQCILQLSKCPP
jgi:hypothetical protein